MVESKHPASIIFTIFNYIILSILALACFIPLVHVFAVSLSSPAAASGGLIPFYMIIRQTGLVGTIWALVLPGAVPVYNIVLLLNFFRQTPRELEEAAIVDGVPQWKIMWQIYVPTSTAALATVALYSTVYHWNDWFSGILYIKTPDQYLLQSYLRSVVIDMKLTNMGAQDWQALALVSDKTVKCAQIFLAALPILLVYPFLQKCFVKGMVLGSVKG